MSTKFCRVNKRSKAANKNGFTWDIQTWKDRFYFMEL